MSIDMDFAEAIKAEIERRGFEVIIAPVVKNNGLILTGVTIKNGSASPTFYLDNVREEHRSPFYVPRIAEEIIEAFLKRSDLNDSVNRAIQMLQENSHELLNHVMPRLVNYEWNYESLQSFPHRRFLDLAITYDIDFEDSTCRISNEIAERMGETEEALYEAARRNAKDRGYNVFPLGEMVKAALDILPIDAPEALPMLVVSNTNYKYGSYALLEDDLFRQISEGIGSIYILPSSVHELIVVPEVGDPESCQERLREMVQAVNRSEVPKDEWLSDSVYVFDGEVRMV